jgi:hypothetical protein
MKKISSLFIFVLAFLYTNAQDTLPNFSAQKKKDGHAYINWYNDYGIVKQITVQRGLDSAKGFASIGSITNAMTKNGEYADKKTKGNHFYYRLFIQLPEGQYFYTKAKRVLAYNQPIVVIKRDSVGNVIKKDTQTTVTVPILPNNPDALQIPKDTLVIVKPKPYAPSDYVFTDKKNNIIIILPNAEKKQYSIIFYDDNDKEILNIPKVKESNLILEKYNFMKSGWYYYKILEGTKVFEEHKFLISKERP